MIVATQVLCVGPRYMQSAEFFGAHFYAIYHRIYIIHFVPLRNQYGISYKTEQFFSCILYLDRVFRLGIFINIVEF